jgi:hypothetical protein
MVGKAHKVGGHGHFQNKGHTLSHRPFSWVCLTLGLNCTGKGFGCPIQAPFHVSSYVGTDIQNVKFKLKDPDLVSRDGTFDIFTKQPKIIWGFSQGTNVGAGSPKARYHCQKLLSKDPLELNANFLYGGEWGHSVIFLQSSCYHMAMVMEWRSNPTKHFDCGHRTGHLTKGSSSWICPTNHPCW